MEKYLRNLKRLCESINADRFNEEKYRNKGTWYGMEIQTQPLFCSYGRIGYSVTAYLDDGTLTIVFDQDMNEMTIDDKPWKQMINTMYLEDESIYPISQTKDGTFELETYTEAGEDMIISIDRLTAESLLEYIDNFDIHEEVAIWWSNGHKIESNGVPFNNIKEHYEDYEDYLKWLRKIAENMPF